MSLALSHAYRSQTTAPNGRVAVEPVSKRIRGLLLEPRRGVVRGGRAGLGARDPYVRVDILRSSRHVTASIGDTLLADSRDTRVVFETGQPPRFFFPRIGVATSELTGSDAVSASPYLGTARHLAYRAGDGDLRDVAWVYVEPTPEAAGLAELVTSDPALVTIRDEHED